MRFLGIEYIAADVRLSPKKFATSGRAGLPGSLEMLNSSIKRRNNISCTAVWRVNG